MTAPASTPVPVAATAPAGGDLRQGLGSLLLVPAPLDFGCIQLVPLDQVMPAGTLRRAARLSHWICENAKSTRAYLKRIDAVQALQFPIRDMAIQELPRAVHKHGDHRGEFDARPLLQAALQGHDIGLISEAGMPAIADPGSSVVRAAHDLGLTVQALVGPVSLLLALAASGLNGQSFAFAGYLPQDPDGRARRVRELEHIALTSGQTQIFIEVPYRNTHMLQTLLHTLGPATRLAVGSALTLSHSAAHSASIARWRTAPWPLDNSTPAVFAIGP